MSHIWAGFCKTCGERYYYSDIVERSDRLRGLSPPERCPKCVKANRRDINSVGVAYWRAPVETDPDKRCWGHFGLGRLARNRLPSEKVEYTGEPTDEVRRQFAIIEPAAQELIENLEDPNGTQVSVLIGPTGTGKSTWVPYRMLRAENITRRGPICVTQPRTVTLRSGKDGEKDAEEDTSTPGFIVRELLGFSANEGVGAGREVGVLFRGESDKHDRYNKLVFVTDGILINWMLSGEIARFSVVMIDEAHELSANMALIFALLRYQLPRYPHLRLVIASATANVQMFREYFGGTNRVFVASPAGATAGQTNFTIFDRWPDETPRYDVPQWPDDIPLAAASLTRAIRTQRGFTKLDKPHGDILVFVPTIRLVNETVKEVRSLEFDGGPKLRVFPCHAQMTENELLAFKHSESNVKRKDSSLPQRVIVATNYAETSVTISNLSYVIDSGLICEPKWETSSSSTSAVPQWHTRAGCTQRKGRLGRVQEGEYFRLYTRQTWDDMVEHPVCALSRERLDGFLLKAKIAGVDDLTTLQWIGRDNQRDGDELQRAIVALRETKALDDDGDVTNHGVELGGIQADSVDLMHFFSESDAFACTLEVATFLAMCEVRKSPFLWADGTDAALVAFAEWRRGCFDDLEFYLRIFHQWESLTPDEEERQSEARKKGLDPSVLSSVEEARRRNLERLSERAHTKVWQRELDLRRLHRVRLVLARCMPRWVYSISPAAGPGTFVPWKQELNSCPEQIYIDRNSACFANPGVTSFVCFSRERKQSKDGPKLLGKHIVRVDPDWLDGLQEPPAAVALRLRRSLEVKHAAITGCEERVAAGPQDSMDAFVKKFRVGSRITAIVIRPPEAEDAEGTRWILATETSTGTPVLLETDRSHKKAGEEFAALVTKIDARHRRIVVSQVGLYKAGEVVQARVETTEPFEDEAGEFRWLFVWLDGNVRGFLHQANIPLGKRDVFTSLEPGKIIENLVVLENDPNNGISLGTKKVYENRNRRWSVGQKVGICIVEDLVWSKETLVYGAKIEIAHGIWGFLPGWRLSFADRGSMSTWQPGDETPPLVIEELPGSEPNRRRYSLAAQDVFEAAAIRFKPGERTSGTVTGFHTRLESGEITAVQIETAPGRTDFIPISALWAARVQEFFPIGDRIDAEVVGVRERGDYQLRPVFPVPREGKRYQGCVTNFLAGTAGYARSGVFVEIRPYTTGVIHWSNVPQDTLLSLQFRDLVDVAVLEAWYEGGKLMVNLLFVAVISTGETA